MNLFYIYYENIFLFSIHSKKRSTTSEELKTMQQKQIDTKGCPNEDSMDTVNPTDNNHLDFNNRKVDHDHTYANITG